MYVGTLRCSQQIVELRAIPSRDFGFTVNCVALCENILSIDQVQMDLAAGPIGTLDEAAIQKVIKSIGYVINSDCKPM